MATRIRVVDALESAHKMTCNGVAAQTIYQARAVHPEQVPKPAVKPDPNKHSVLKIKHKNCATVSRLAIQRGV